MNTVDEIQEAIRRLSRYEREMLVDWTRHLAIGEHRVAEAALAYRGRVHDERPTEQDFDSDPELMSVEEYLTFNEGSPVRHEYIAGRAYAMPAESLRHNEIITNLVAAFKPLLRGGPHRVFHSGVLARFKTDEEDIVYSPDVIVLCGPYDSARRYVSDPCLVIEVLSASTERVDRREKADSYRHIPALQEYVLIAQHAPRICIQRRNEQWRPVFVSSLDAIAEFRSVDASMPLRQIYEGVLK